MTQERAKLLVKIIFFFAAFIVVCLFGIIIGQTIKHNNLLAELDRTREETVRIEEEGKGLDDKLGFFLEDIENPESVKQEIIDEILLREGYVEKGSDTEIYE